MKSVNYNPETYWSEVAKRIKSRAGKNIIAGDDEPYYRYKRAEFLKLLHSVSFTDKKVLEVGCGPGGNLQAILQQKPKQLYGVDISQEMVNLSSKLLEGSPVSITKINGTTLPFDDKTMDISFSATVLQHNTDDSMMEKILREMCRVTSDKVVLFERINKVRSGDELCVGRPIEQYEEICKQEGFTLSDIEFINIYVSYLACGVSRKVFNPASRQEGEPLTKFSLALQNALLPITKPLDKIFTAKQDVAKLVFVRKE